METFAIIFSWVFLIYMMIGFLFALWFVTKGVGQMDEVAQEVSWWFRLFILPGSMALWPILLIKWLKR